MKTIVAETFLCGPSVGRDCWRAIAHLKTPREARDQVKEFRVYQQQYPRRAVGIFWGIFVSCLKEQESLMSVQFVPRLSNAMLSESDARAPPGGRCRGTWFRQNTDVNKRVIIDSPQELA